MPRNRAEAIKEILFVFKSKDTADVVFVAADVLGVEYKFMYSWENGRFVPEDCVNHYPPISTEDKITWWKLSNFRRADKSYVNSLITIVEYTEPGSLVTKLKNSPRTGLWYYRTPDVDESCAFGKSFDDGLIF